MKKLIMCLLLIGLALPCMAVEPNWEVAYHWCHINGYTNVTWTMKEALVITGEPNASLAYIICGAKAWKPAVTNPPSYSYCTNAANRTAGGAYVANEKKDRAVTFTDLPPKWRGLLKLLIQKGVFTKAEAKAALKAEM